MLVGKSHKIIPLMENLQKKIDKAYALSLQNCQSQTPANAIDVRIAIEAIQYEVDKIATKDAQTIS